LLESIDAGLRDLTARIDALEHRVATAAPDLAPSDEPDPASQLSRIPSFAVRNDGKVLLSVAHLEGCDLAGREPWEGVVLSEAETWDAIDRLSHFFDETAGYTAGRLLHKGTKRGDEPDEGGSDE
jgi:hypothetical protein